MAVEHLSAQKERYHVVMRLNPASLLIGLVSQKLLDAKSKNPSFQ